MDETQERRKSKRYPVDVPVEVTELLKGKKFSMLTKDVSTAGVFVKTMKVKMFPAGTAVSLAFISTTSSTPILVNGEVVRAVDKSTARQTLQEPGLGIMFLNLDQLDTRSIERCILVDVIKQDKGG